MKKLIFKLKIDDDGYPPVGYESLWGGVIGEKSYIVDNIPYYIFGVSKGDCVVVEEVEGESIATAIVSRGGHSTLRVVVQSHDDRVEILKALADFGANCSTTSGLSMFAVDIPAHVDFLKIDTYLAAQSDGENIAYEDACLQHAGIENGRIAECRSLDTIPSRLN